jgi:hypothetical protein
VAAGLAVVGVCVVGFLIGHRSPQPESGELPPPAPTPDPDRVPYRDDTQVIGVTLGDRHRAYLLADLWRPDRHVQNDLFDDIPVSVTFCDLDNCVKAFTDDTRGRPLDLRNGGPHPKKSRKMILGVGGRTFEQDTGRPLDGDTDRPFPYAAVPAVRTTWGEWRTAHPDTDLRANGRLYPPAKPRAGEPLNVPPGARREVRGG